MNLKNYAYVLISCFLFSTSVFASDYVKETEAFLDIIERSYGPLQYKEKRFNWSWEQLRAETLSKAKECKTSKDFYLLTASTLSQLQDAHVSLQLPTQLIATLPIQLYKVGSKVLVNYVSDQVDENTCPILPGDELVLFDGKTAEELQNKFLKTHTLGNPETDQTYSSLMLTRRTETSGDFEAESLRDKTSFLQFRRTDSTPVFICKLKWKVTGSSLVIRDKNTLSTDTTTSLMTLAQTPPELYTKTQRQFAQIQLISEKIHQFANLTAPLDLEFFKKKKKALGTKKGKEIKLGNPEPLFKLPKDFKRIKLNWGLSFLLQDNLFAGTFSHNGKRVGYLRIGSYVPSLIQFSIVGLKHAVQKLQETSDYLIIDQLFNPGGYVIYSDWVAKALTGEYNDQKHMRFTFKPTQGTLQSLQAIKDLVDQALQEAEEQGNEADKIWIKNNKRLQANLKMAEEDFEAVKAAYQKELPLTPPIRLYPLSDTIEEMISHLMSDGKLGVFAQMITGMSLSKPVHYTKPVYFLINELDFSGGDATPAILQDYGRVKFIGKNTAGAGGSVGTYQFSSGEPFQFHLTESLMVRANGGMVENIGVKPDLPFEFTESDIRNEYKDALTRVLGLIDNDQKK